MTTHQEALEAFTEYFVKNYPGDTIIHDPKWHAPRIFRAAVHTLATVNAEPALYISDKMTVASPRLYSQMVPHAKAGWKPLYAAPQASAPIAVEKLKWVEDWGGSNEDIPCWRGKNSLGLYVCIDFAGRLFEGRQIERHDEIPADVLAAAKAAAQADYERRIRSALVEGGEAFPQPVRKDGGEPCGECHIQPGETCDICGAVHDATPAPADERVTISTGDAKTLIGVIEEFYVHNELSREEARAFLSLCQSGNFGRPIVTGRRQEQPADERVVEALEAVATDIDRIWREKGGLNCTEVCAIVRIAALKAQEGGR